MPNDTALLVQRAAFLANRRAFECFLHAWESGTLARAEFTHAAHVAVAACYAVRFGEAAFDHVRLCILRHNAAAGILNTDTSGYHETLTRFWVAIASREVRGMRDPFEAARHAVEKFGEARSLPARFYSFDVLRSTEARRRWIAPDSGDLSMEDR